MAASPLKNRKFKYGWGIGWLAWIVFQAWLVYTAGFNWQTAFIDSIISNVILSIMSLAITNSLRYYRPGETRYVYLLAWCFCITLAWAIISAWTLKSFIGTDAVYASFLQKSLPLRFGGGLLITGCISMISWMWYNLEEQKRNEEQKTETITLMRDAELHSLRQQLSPHFLFNSLNSISALTSARPEKARYMIQQLADFFRSTLKTEDNRLISFKEELDRLSLYLEIEKVRFGHRLKDVIVLEAETTQAMLPALILQPIMENSIKYGLYDTTGEVIIHLSATVQNGVLEVKITNPYDPVSSNAVKGTGFGLRSIRRRLYLIYGRNDLLETITKDNIFTTILKIPYKNDKSDINR